MTGLSEKQAQSRSRTLLTALLLSAPGPLVTGLATLSSQATTQLADFIRRSTELVALFVSWWVFRRIRRNPSMPQRQQAHLERITELSVAGTMIASALILLGVALSRLAVHEPGGNVISGLVIAVLGLITNGIFWRRYTILTRESYTPVIASQQKLYRAKASIDLCVVAALTAVAVAPAHPITRYVDVLGSIIVAAYLLWSGVRMAWSELCQGDSRPDVSRAQP